MRVEGDAPTTTGAGSSPRLTRLRSGATRIRSAVTRRFRRLPIAWQRAILAVLVLRVAVALASFAFGGLLPGLEPVDVEPVYATGFGGWQAPGADGQGYGLLGASLERFDALWYLAIAEDGYPGLLRSGRVPGAGAFFPGFPLLVGVAGRLLLGHYLLAANLVTLVAAVAALAGVHHLVEEETGDDALASRALVVTSLFPAAFFLVAPYTEGLFLATSVWSLVLARRGRWWPAAGLAAAAALTRNVGVLLVLPLVIEVFRQVREDRAPGWAGLVGAVGGPPAGLALFAAFSWARFGTPFGPVEAQIGWERTWQLPTESLGDAWRFAVNTPGLYPSGYHTMDVVIFVPVALGVLWLLWRTPWPYGVYAAAHVLVWLVYPFPGRPLMSAYRFAIAIAPLPWAFAAWTRSPRVARVWDAASAALLGVILLLFVGWYYVF